MIEISTTASGGFAGYQTSADSILIFDEIGDSGEHLKLRARHEGDGCENKSIELEKGVLRPFLFGRDIGRWAIDWKRTWVLFPYDKYLRKRTLNGDDIEEWNLIPCKANIKKFEFVGPDSIEIFEDRFPYAWKYLRKHEDALRKREDEVRSELASMEAELNGLVYKLYGVTPEEQRVVNDFLDRYSSRSAAEIADDAEVPEG